jgi:hypothetical protein
MSSDLQIAANQSNAQKSTGPRSEAGRALTRYNARRHGLAVEIGRDPAFHDDVEKLAKILSHGKQIVSEQAREAARAEVDLSRIRKVRAELFDTLYYAGAALPDGLIRLNENLTKLERYERRAFSRRNRALRAMYWEARGCARLCCPGLTATSFRPAAHQFARTHARYRSPP